MSSMNQDPLEDLSEKAWRGPLTKMEQAQLDAWLAAHPEARAEWEADAALSAAQHAAIAFRPDISFPWHYPPPFLLAVLPLGLLPYPAALAAFVIGTSALYGALIRRTVPDPRF